MVSYVPQADSHAGQRVLAVQQQTDDEPSPETSAKMLEPLVLELVSMIQCVEMYCRYVYGHVRCSLESILPRVTLEIANTSTLTILPHVMQVSKTSRDAEAAIADAGVKADGSMTHEPMSGPAVALVDPAMVSKLSGEMKERVQGVVGHYISLEEHIFRQNVAKAVALNTLESPTSKTTTLVDDAFFVIAKSARRALSSLHADAICAILNQIRALLEVDYILIFNAQLKVCVRARVRVCLRTLLLLYERVHVYSVTCV